MTSPRLVLFVGGVFFAESAFYSVIPPLVPRLAREVGLTTTAVGILVAAYPAGVLLAAAPAIVLVRRRGVRITTIAGLGLLVASTLGFGWGRSPLMLDAARLLQGMGGAVAWAGALAWLTSATPEGRRGSVIGGALGAALVGMVFGPALGALAARAGRAEVFSAVAAVLLVLAFAGPAAAPIAGRAAGSTRALARLFRSPPAVMGIGILLLVGIVSGTLGTLVPLLVANRQGGPEVIAAILGTSYLLAALLNLLLGRLSDRFGRLRPAVAALAVGAALLPLLPFFHPMLTLAAGTVVASASVAGLWTPTAAMVTDGSDPGASGHALGVATMNAAWAAGGAGGAAVVARLADSVGFVPPFALVGGLCAAVTLAMLPAVRGQRRRRPRSG